MRNLMIDIETLSTQPDAAILTIGAVFFDPLAGTIGPTFYERIRPEDAVVGRHVSGETLAWWMVQPDAARQEVMGGNLSLFDALRSLTHFIATQCPDHHPDIGLPLRWSWPDLKVWANGSSFDIVILEHAYRSINHPTFITPWTYRAARDVRTILTLPDVDKPPRDPASIQHHALDDAIYQAQCIISAYRQLGFSPSGEEDGHG